MRKGHCVLTALVLFVAMLMPVLPRLAFSEERVLFPSERVTLGQWGSGRRLILRFDLSAISGADKIATARLVLTEGCPTLSAVDDGLRVYFHPGLVAKLLSAEDARSGLRQMAWVLVHEISHVIRDHSDRARDRRADPLSWNVAADLEINDGEWPGMEPPRTMPPLLPDQFGLPEGKLAEYYYNNLRSFRKVQLERVS